MIFLIAPYQERLRIIVVDASSSGPEAACIGSLQTTKRSTLLHGRIDCSLCCTYQLAAISGMGLDLLADNGANGPRRASSS